jgi:hypothetical protein
MKTGSPSPSAVARSGPGWGARPRRVPMIDQIERYHRRHKRDKNLTLRRQCSSPTCTTAWETLADSPFCLACHTQAEDRADALRAHNEARRTTASNNSERQNRVEELVDRATARPRPKATHAPKKPT